MAVEDPAKTSRDQILSTLEKALDDWKKNDDKAIAAEANFLRNVIKARGGAASLAKANVSASSILLANDIGSFLTGAA